MHLDVSSERSPNEACSALPGCRVRQILNFNDKEVEIKGGPNKESSQLGLAENKSGLAGGSEVLAQDSDVDHFVSACSFREVDHAVGIGELSRVEEVAHLLTQRAKGRAFVAIGRELASELPADGAGRELSTIRLGEGKIFEWHQRRFAACGPNMSTSVDWDEGVEIGLVQELVFLDGVGVVLHVDGSIGTGATLGITSSLGRRRSMEGGDRARVVVFRRSH